MVFQRFPEDTRKRLRDHEDNTEPEAKKTMKTRLEPQSRQGYSYRSVIELRFQLCRLTES